jgi:hypothetical protein
MAESGRLVCRPWEEYLIARQVCASPTTFIL